MPKLIIQEPHLAKIKRLIKNCRGLGLQKGLKFWNLENQAEEPEALKAWLDDIDAAAVGERKRGNFQSEQSLNRYAKKLRKEQSDYLELRDELLLAKPSQNL